MTSRTKKTKEAEYQSAVFPQKVYERLTERKTDAYYALNPERGADTFYFRNHDGKLFFARKARVDCFETQHLREMILLPPHISNQLWPYDMITLSGQEPFLSELSADLTQEYTSISDTEKEGEWVLLLFPVSEVHGYRNLASEIQRHKEQDPTQLSYKSSYAGNLAAALLRLLHKLRMSGWLTWDFELSRFLINGAGEILADFSLQTRPYHCFLDENCSAERLFDGNRTAVAFSEPSSEQAFIRGTQAVVTETYINFSTAAMLFLLFVGRLPYDGAFLDGTREDSPLLRSQKFQRYYLNPIFIFDEKDTSNGLSRDFSEELLSMKNWQRLPLNLKKYFYAVFTERDVTVLQRICALNPSGWLYVLEHAAETMTEELISTVQKANAPSGYPKTYFYPLLRKMLKEYGKENLTDPHFMETEMEQYELYSQDGRDLLLLLGLDSTKKMILADAFSEELFRDAVSEMYAKTLLYLTCQARPLAFLMEIAEAVFGVGCTEKISLTKPEIFSEVQEMQQTKLAFAFGHGHGVLASMGEKLAEKDIALGKKVLLFCHDRGAVGGDVLWKYVPEEKKQETGFFRRTIGKSKSGITLLTEALEEVGNIENDSMLQDSSWNGLASEKLLNQESSIRDAWYGWNSRKGLLYMVCRRKDGTLNIEMRSQEGTMFPDEDSDTDAPQILCFGITEEEYALIDHAAAFEENPYLNALTERLLRYLPEDRYLQAFTVQNGIREASVRHLVPTMDGGSYALEVRSDRLLAFTNLPAVYLVEKRFGEEHYPILDKEDRIVCFDGRREAEDYIRAEELKAADAVLYTQDEFREKAAVLLNDGVRTLVLRKKNAETQGISLSDLVPNAAKLVASFQAELALSLAVTQKAIAPGEAEMSEEMTEMARKLQESVLFIPLYYKESQPGKAHRNAVYVTANAQAALDRRHMNIDSAAKEMEMISLEGGFLPFRADEFIGEDNGMMVAWTDLRGELQADAYLLGNYYEVSQRVFKTLSPLRAGLLKYEGLQLVSGRTKCRLSISDLKKIDLFLYGKARKCATE